MQPGLIAQDDPAAQFKAIKKEFDDMMSGWREKSQKASAEMRTATPERRQEISKTMMEAQTKLMETINATVAKAVKLMEVKDKAVAFDVINFVLTNPYINDAKIKDKAYANIANHLDNEKLTELLQLSGRGLPSQATEDMFRVIAGKKHGQSRSGIGHYKTGVLSEIQQVDDGKRIE